MSNSRKRIKKNIGYVLFFIFSACVAPYLATNIYNFEEPKTFTGNFLFNPYKPTDSVWLKSNFHAHSIAWDGITNGKQQPMQVLNTYAKAGYDFAALSNYQTVAVEDENKTALSAYEHGYNIFKTHQLALLPEQVCYTDFPLIQFASCKQYMIDELAKNSKAVVIAHPMIRDGYSDNDLRKLTGYNLMEVLNHSINSSAKWDVALSAGKPVWIVGDDDSHNAYDSSQTFRNWTMVGCAEHNKDSLIKNSSTGNAYGITGNKGKSYNQLKSMNVDSMTMNVSLMNVADSILLIGQNGVIETKLFNTDEVDYTFSPRDTYIRIVAYTNNSAIYLNPVVRYDGKLTPDNISTASINIFLTLLYRITLSGIWIFAFGFVYRNSLSKLLKLIRYKLSGNQESPQYTI